MLLNQITLKTTNNTLKTLQSQKTLLESVCMQTIEKTNGSKHTQARGL